LSEKIDPTERTEKRKKKKKKKKTTRERTCIKFSPRHVMLKCLDEAILLNSHGLQSACSLVMYPFHSQHD